LALASECSKPIDSGQITEKIYEPKREYVQIGTILLGGKIMVPYKRTMIDDEDYIITFGRFEEDGKFRTRMVYVSEEVYNS